MAYKMKGKLGFRCDEELEYAFLDWCKDNNKNPALVHRDLTKSWLDRQLAEEVRLKNFQEALDTRQKANKAKRAEE